MRTFQGIEFSLDALRKYNGAKDREDDCMTWLYVYIGYDTYERQYVMDVRDDMAEDENGDYVESYSVGPVEFWYDATYRIADQYLPQVAKLPRN